MKSAPEFAHIVTVDDELTARRCAKGRVVVIDDDGEILSALRALIELEDFACETYESATAFLQVMSCNRPCFPGPSCVLCDVKMPELSGLALQQRLAQLDEMPLILMSGDSGAPEAVQAFRAGAVDFLIKPMPAEAILGAIEKALSLSAARRRSHARSHEIEACVARLTERELQIARRVASGETNQAIADELGIALRSVKRHRQNVMEKLGASSTPDLVRLLDEAARV